MGNIGLPELLIVLVIVLVVFGPKRLPEMGKQLGRTIREFRAATSEIRSQIGVDDITRSVTDIRSTLSFTGDAQAASQPAAATVEPAGVAPAVVSATVAAPAVAPVDAPATVEPAGVETFGKLRRSTAPTPASTPAD
jgi:sec-independent protein translocase protein TatA